MKKRWSEFKYWAVILLLLAVLFELVASMLLFRKYVPAKSASLHIISNLIEKKDAEQYAYEPWLMFRLADYQSDKINIRGFERKSVPDAFFKDGSSDTIDIYFFGGSTMFGYHLSDNETIPSKFVRACMNENLSKSIRVKNFGIPHYYSKQELMLLTSLLFKGDRPDIVVFFDGINDFYPARMLYYDRPFFSYALQQSFEGKMLQRRNQTFVDSTDDLYNTPAGISETDYNNALITKYTNNIRMAANLCKTAAIKSYFFCQPVRFYSKDSTTKNHVKGNWQRIESIYRKIEENRDSLGNFYFLGDVNEERGYIDGCNYTSAFADEIAKEILNDVKNDLR